MSRVVAPGARRGADTAPGDDLLDARVLLGRQDGVLELIAANAPLGDVLTGILTALERLIPGASCSVLLLDRELGTLHHGAAPTLPAEYVAAIDGMAIGDGAGSCGTAAALNTAVVASDVRVDPRWVDFRATADGVGLRSCWSTPIDGRDGLPVGTFAVYHSHPHHPTEHEQRLVDRFTHLASVAIDHAGLVGELVESEERFRRSFDDNPLGMAILGLDRTIVSCNTALTALAARSSLVGCDLADLVTSVGGSLGARLDELDELDGVAPLSFDGFLRREVARGERACAEAVEVEVTASLLRDRDGAPAQYVVNVLDLTERRAAEGHHRARLEAETARRTAEEHSHAKSELLAAVGHEARTPIQAIVGFAELLATMDLDESRRREALTHIGSAAGHVMDLLTDMLDLSRVEAGALPMAIEPVRLQDVVLEVLGLLSTKADQRRVELSHSVTEEVVRADRRRLRQVLLNLVGNAIRHGRVDGRVHVGTAPAPAPADLLVSVVDDGPGIAPDLRPRLFAPFVRDPGHEESVGLGLALAHGLASAMDGELVVGGSACTGTTMTLRLPRAGSGTPPTWRPGSPRPGPVERGTP